MIDIQSESLLRVPTEASKVIPGRPNVSTIWRWFTRGIKGVKLETVLVGGRRYTSHEAIARFVEQTTAAAGNGHRDPRSTPASRQREIERAEKECIEAGI